MTIARQVNERTILGTRDSEISNVLTFTLYNADAITASDTEESAPKVTVTLKTDDTENASTVTFDIRIIRKPATINVTVPLNLLFTTNLNGGSCGAPGDYSITNNSDTRIVLESANIRDMSSEMHHTVASPGYNQYKVEFQKIGASIAKGEGCHPINSMAVGPLGFCTADGQYLQIACISYTLAIPAD